MNVFFDFIFCALIVTFTGSMALVAIVQTVCEVRGYLKLRFRKGPSPRKDVTP